MIISNYNSQDSINLPVPTMVDIQKILAKEGALRLDHIGSTKWVEPHEALIFLRHYGINGKVEVYPSQTAAALSTRLFQHFTTHKTPVMIDDSIFAYCLVGIRRRLANSSIVEVLRFDPHVSERLSFEDFASTLEATTPHKPAVEKAARWLSIDNALTTNTGKWMVYFPMR